jgi:23S rRNA pseudouridine2605 synthase
MQKFNRGGKPGKKGSFSGRGKNSDRKGSFKKKDHGGDRDDKPFRKKSQGDDNERSSGRGGKGFGRKDSYSRERSGDRDDKPFRKKVQRSDDSERGEKSSRGRDSFRKDRDNDRSGDKPFRKKFPRDDNERTSSREGRSFRGKDSFRKDRDSNRGDDTPFRKKFDRDNERDSSKERRSFRGKDSFRKDRDSNRDGDKPFRKKFHRDDNEGASERGEKSFSRRDSYNKDRKGGDEKPFRKKFEGDSDRNFSSGEKFKEKGSRKPFFSDRKFGEKRNSDKGDNRYEERNRDFEGEADSERFSKGTKNYEGSPRNERFEKRKPKRSAPQPKENPEGLTRLNKYLANAGIASRREADNLIKSGAVKVNDVVVTEMGHKIKPGDKVTYGDAAVKGEKKVYLLLNKPKDYITTVDDPRERKTVMDLIAGACRERVYPVGRLDRNTTGLLLLTNDGELTKKLTHPKYGIKKVYHVSLNKGLKPEDFSSLAEGIELEDGMMKVDDIAFVGEGKKEIGIEIHSGRNRIVRRLFEHLGYDVIKLDRVVFAGLTKKDLPRGKYRFLTQKEVNFLQMIG